MKRVAVVEDNPDNRLLVRAILEDHYELSEYATGSEALSGLADDVPDVILLDISLPEMDGTEILAYLRKDERYAKVPVIALTAHAMVGDRERFLAAGFNSYFSKPILEPDLLIDSIEELLRASSDQSPGS